MHAERRYNLIYTVMAGFDSDLESIVQELNQKVKTTDPADAEFPGPQPVECAEDAAGPSDSLDDLLRVASRRTASDLILVAGSGLILRINGSLVQSSGASFSEDDIKSLVLPLLTQRRRQELERTRTVDFSFVREGIGRFRTNVHFQRGTMAAAIRLLPDKIPTLDELHLPPALAELTNRKQGLVLVTGPTGSGKSTTLATLIGMINRNHPHHIITIEDPIEYYHENENSVFEQMEVGHDAESFASALRSILRQSPDVILVGEMRDPETMAAAVTAAETGHLVFSTLHTNDTIQAVGRIVDSFPGPKQNQIRQQLSLGLLAIIAQQLVPAADGRGRYPATEILLANTAVSHIIRKAEDHMLRSQLSLGRSEGMMMMEESLAELVRSGSITYETASRHCFRPEEFQRYMQQ